MSITAALDEVFDCADLTKFAAIVQEQLQCVGYSDSVFFLCELQGVEFLTKFSLYNKSNPEIYSTAKSLDMSPYDTEIAVLTLLKRRIINQNYSPGFVELAFAKTCDAASIVTPSQSHCDKFTTEKIRARSMLDLLNKRLCAFRSMVAAGLAYDKFSFLVLEECDITLHAYFTNYTNDNSLDLEVFKALLFQTIHAIAVAKMVWPQFKHRDLHMDNVMVKFDTKYVFDVNKPKFTVYNLAGVKYTVPYFGMVCKIIDFGFTTIPEEQITSSVNSDPLQMYLRTDFDILFLFHDIYNSDINHPAIRSLLALIEPTRSFQHHNRELIEKHAAHILSPADMLKSKPFALYRSSKASNGQIHHEYHSPPV